MQVNRFWGSVWSVAAYLFALGLLQIILAQLVTLFGLLPAAISGLLRLGVMAAVPIVATFAYLDWRWGWGPEHIGLPRRGSAVALAPVGMAIGAVAALAAHGASALLGGEGADLGSIRLAALSPGSLIDLLLAILLAFALELSFRGVVISRYQADLTEREAVLAGVLTPFAWAILSAALLGGYWTAGIDGAWQAAMSVALSLLFFRTDSVWLSTGLRVGMLLTPSLLNLRVTEQGGLAVWGVAAAVLAAMEWLRLGRMPKPMGPRPNPFRSYRGGRSRQGPWGPH